MEFADREEVCVEMERVEVIDIEGLRVSSGLDLDLDNEDERASWVVETYS